MPSIFFWKTWTSSYRRLWIAISGVSIFSLLFFWYTFFQGAAGVIHWEKIQEQKIIETTVHRFQLGPFDLSVPAESYVIFEYLQGSDVQHNTTASYIFLAVLVICSLMLLSVFTTLERFWYFAAMSLFILFVVSLRLDVLLVFNQRGIAVPAAVLVIFLAISFYFKSMRPHTRIPARFATFLGAATITGIVISFFARVPYPMLHLAVASYIPALVLSILFIVMVAHEIMVSFIYITSQGPSKSLRHFSIISAIYLVNVFITCLHEMGTIEWSFIYINLYLLLSVSAILGLWGFKLRESLYENIMPFSPSGAFFFIALAGICLATIGQLMGNANDPALKVIRHIIAFTHAAFGLVFLMYIFSNFMVMMAQNLPVHKILYKPSRMPYFTFRLAGVIVTLAFVFTSHWRDYLLHSAAGFYNYAADLYTLQGNETFARAFYERSSTSAFQTHRANYSLGMMKAVRLDFEDAQRNFDLANGKNPTDFSLVNQGNLHLWMKRYFPAIETFRAANKIQASPALQNNLAFAYARVHNLDSAVYYISNARKHDLTRATAETNFFALIASEYLPIKTDSILKDFDTTSPAVVSNAIAAATLFGQPFNLAVNPFTDETPDLYAATLLNNYIIANATTLDTAFTSHAYRIASNAANAPFSEALKASLAYAYYHQGNVHKAQEILAELAYLTQSYQGKYNYIMGLWALEQNNPQMAHSYFTHAVAANYKQAKLYNAIALTEAGFIPPALLAWDSVAQYGEPSEQAIAAGIRQVLTLKPEQALTATDAIKYQYSRYMVTVHDTAYFARLSNTFDDPNLKAQALLDMAQKQFKADRIIAAIRFFNQTSGLELTDKKLYENIRHFELRMLASRAEILSITRQINKGITFDPSRSLEKMLYTALVTEASNDHQTAEKNYEILGSWNPYFEDGILAAATYFTKRDSTSAKPYNMLAEAIQVNSNSIRLLKAYVAEAARQGFDEYAASAMQRLIELERE